MHNSKYALARHPWDEPLNNAAALAAENPEAGIVLPRIGEPVRLDRSDTLPGRWWTAPEIERERRSAFALFFYLSPVFPALFFALIGYGFHQLADLFGIAQKVIFHQT